MAQKPWSIDSYKMFPAEQQPVWPDPVYHRAILEEIRNQPPLVFAGEVRELKRQLAEVAQGKAFLLQAGDCAEEFQGTHGKNIREKLKILLQMAVVLTYGNLTPVVKIGRIAGQYSKPRSKPTEEVNGQTLPSFRGDSVNAITPTLEARTPDSNRLLRAYHQSAATLNLLRAFTHGGFADLSRVHSWNLDFVKNSPLGNKYEAMAEDITRALAFMRACGIDSEKFPQLHQVDLYTSHEALLLDYEAALSRVDSLTGDWYNCSAHFIWIGERTRQLDGAHLEYFRGIKNPVGVKIGPTCDRDTLLKLVEKLNPENEPGRLTLITRFGADKIESCLPPLVRAVRDEGASVVWSCDPMHGNTYTTTNGYKTRHFEKIVSELDQFFQIHVSEGTHPGGVHLELTGDHVTECLGGVEDITDEELPYRYNTACDPRLNAKQSLELSLHISEILKKKAHQRPDLGLTVG
ncbi:MAG: 3-deoxy-7-phosphoheptulonate synthase class II [Acidobacteria bacterium]|nr:3-deoxy-7-phosphoheptulonate synthase class II [Acidobacteriota bacterium]MCB9398035.1 3-deoxy-7-phosphoheptulonate synthase class II [Acidobacteriota bacterium]